MADLEDRDLADNYRQLHDGTGEPWESIAQRVDATGDRNTAAWLRQQAAGEGEITRESEPEERSAPAKGSIAAAETPKDEA